MIHPMWQVGDYPKYLLRWHIHTKLDSIYFAGSTTHAGAQHFTALNGYFFYITAPAQPAGTNWLG